MKRDTLLDFFDDRIQSDATFLTYDDGYRTFSYRYDEIRCAARRLARRLTGAGLSVSDTVVVWGENRPEWIVALWGCLLARAVVVPIDYRSSGELVGRIVDIVEARVLLYGDEVAVPELPHTTASWALRDLMLLDGEAEPSPSTTGDHGRDVAPPSGRDLAEIIFTSGATAAPKGVTLTHRNILSNIIPVEREILKYRKYGRPFFPLRFLNLLPLSHMFGQAMATFVPPLLEGVTVFQRSLNPADIVRQIASRRISVLVCVPKMLEVLRDHVVHVVPEAREEPRPGEHVARRWWRYRRVHRLFGVKVWAFVVGAAPLPPELEAFWTKLGFVVIQGYGLTETAPIVTLNHPFRTRRGSVGTPIGGVELKIAPDGEILVRGDNVTSGYYRSPNETAAAFEDGWFHTGDIGAVDESGRLTVRGRKKEMIVTPEGLNVFPEDVERALGEQPGVQDVAVVGISTDGKERVHAVLVLDRGADIQSVLHRANERLEDHQRVRGHSVWTDGPLPRTEGTQKLKRREIRAWVKSGYTPQGSRPQGPTGARSVVQQFAGERPIDADTTLADLGLSSIERIELMMALERELDITVDETTLEEATTVAELEALLETTPAVPAPTVPDGRPATGQAPGSRAPEQPFPTWSRSRPARFVRRMALAAFLLPLTRVFAWIRVEGLDRLADVPGPVVYAANHQSHMDGPVILAALPSARRRTVAIAAAREFFGAHFHPESHPFRRRMVSSLTYYLSSLLFNVFPLPQREAGARRAIRYVGELVGTGTSVLIFPEGRRTEDGEIGEFRPGIGMIASRLRVPVVPIRIEGLDQVLHQSWRMARPGRVRVAFGEPLILTGDDYESLAKQVEEAVRRC